MPKRNPRVFFDIAIGNNAGGRVEFELYADVTPRAAENFRGLCTGEYGTGRTSKKPLSYDGCKIFRCVKGQYLQSGDFVHNNGDGGESIYGGTFNDEDFTRRHTCAGVLSMANRGRNTNGSQFFITLKRQPQLDGKHIVVGQCVGGMDVIRAAAMVPVDKNDAPRVPIRISGCGEVLDFIKKNQASSTVVQSKKIAGLEDEEEGVWKPGMGGGVRWSEGGKAILAGKAGGVPVPESEKVEKSEEVDELEGGGVVVNPSACRNPRERKLLELKLRMNQCRTSNNKEVIEEQKRFADPDYQRQQAAEKKHKREEKQMEEENGPMPGQLPKGKEYLNDTAEHVELREAKKKRGDPNAFSWDVFNQDALYRAHDKRVKHLEFDQKAYDDQKKKTLQWRQKHKNVMWLSGDHGLPDEDELNDMITDYIQKLQGKGDD
eukprot:gnl/TRDRNA2_/TRDRNA2_174848_c8_seq9.p1 gnl/TRDRNA2_/TRDRNA2_174848_c8~~gnl/TRDRNA2_/TRDRNA2_174848_c8_seq9.p1  ORF type:complete len:432 (+),score=116.04 gnl/TRDRNA2_/TRDRNA2_174848_c8_seq9:88-1383(+)